MTDFPRGWTLSNESVGGTASITVPGIAGVVHVLDSFDATTNNQTAATIAENVTLTSSDGTFTNMIIGLVVAGADSGGEASASGLDLAAGPGASLTIAFGAGAANLVEFLLAQGHDI